MAVPDNVHMRRTMVIGINDNPQSAKPQNGWHVVNVSQTEALGIYTDKDSLFFFAHICGDVLLFGNKPLVVAMR